MGQGFQGPGRESGAIDEGHAFICPQPFRIIARPAIDPDVMSAEDQALPDLFGAGFEAAVAGRNAPRSDEGDLQTHGALPHPFHNRRSRPRIPGGSRRPSVPPSASAGREKPGSVDPAHTRMISSRDGRRGRAKSPARTRPHQADKRRDRIFPEKSFPKFGRPGAIAARSAAFPASSTIARARPADIPGTDDASQRLVLDQLGEHVALGPDDRQAVFQVIEHSRPEGIAGFEVGFMDGDADIGPAENRPAAVVFDPAVVEYHGVRPEAPARRQAFWPRGRRPSPERRDWDGRSQGKGA